MDINNWVDTTQMRPINGFELKVKKLREHGQVNSPAHAGDAGHDVYATESVIIKPGERYNMPLGVAIEMPNWLVCYVEDKSGIFKNRGLHNGGSVIDCNYRGEIHAQIINLSNIPQHIDAGTKIAQLVFVPYFVARITVVEELSETKRGEAGFGSTGVK